MASGSRLVRAAVAVLVGITVFGASCGCAEAEYIPAPAPKTPLIGDLRDNFRHWDELVADKSPTAAKTRAEVAWAALDGDDRLLARFRARGIYESAIVAQGVADAERAAAAFPKERDAWTTLASLRAYRADFKGAADAACKGADASPKSVDIAIVCVERLLQSNRRADAIARATSTMKLLDTTDQSAFRHAMLARDRLVGEAVACEPDDARIGYEAQLACGDHFAASGDRRAAKKRYHAAFLEAQTQTQRFVAMQRSEEAMGDCKDELVMLPPAQAKEYPLWKEMVGGPYRRYRAAHPRPR